MIGRLDLTGFDNLKTGSLEKFRDSIAKQLGLAMAKIREQDENITEDPIWNLLREIKLEILDGKTSLSGSLERCARLQVGVSGEKGSIQDLLDKMGSIARTEKYKLLVEEDNLVFSTKVHVVAKAGMFAPPAKKNAAVKTETMAVKQRIYYQVDNVSNKEVDKKEVVRVLMREASPRGFCGKLIDLHSDVTSKIEDSKLGKMSVLEKLAEREKLGNIILAEKIDSIVEECKAQGIKRVQIFLVTTSHYTPCDIDIENRSCLIFDAAQDARHNRLVDAAKLCKCLDADKVIDTDSKGFVMQGKVINGGEIQKTEYGCWVFSSKQAFEICQLPNIHHDLLRVSKLNETTGKRTVEWLDYPPQVVMMAQSTTFLEYYMSKKPEFRETILRLTNNNEKGYGFSQTVAEFKKIVVEACVNRSEEEIESFLREASIIKPR